jgi:three-Cys-motif partner protein
VAKKPPDDKSRWLLELPELEAGESEPLVSPLPHPIWTENKAKLIEAYLRFFLYITHHGTYVDCFAGPQEPEMPEMWSAKLVLEIEPRWLRRFYLFEKHPKRFKQLAALKASQPEDHGRLIELYEGDVNVRIHELLDAKSIAEKQATFCLLDQRTFECHWDTLRALAEYKKEGRKIELFYFLASKWLARAMSAVKDKSILQRWWGRDDWERLIGMKPDKCAAEVVGRFKSEFGYASAKRWPIFNSKQPGLVMYYMIHASDHDEAPKQMRRAYAHAVTADNSEQIWIPGMEPPQA